MALVGLMERLFFRTCRALSSFWISSQTRFRQNAGCDVSQPLAFSCFDKLALAVLCIQ